MIFIVVILITLNNENNILFIDVSTSSRKSSSRPTSGSGRQYVKASPIRGSIGSSPRLDSCSRLPDLHRIPYVSARFGTSFYILTTTTGSQS